nr:transglutaminase family protein [Planococcus glaciei]
MPDLNTASRIFRCRPKTRITSTNFYLIQKKGYCDNFSTSMVVLLRSLDIPARWVKGFNEGEIVETKDDTDIYQITNNNAHSWVEAYMPGVGWMLFEPTIGFTGSSAVEFDVEVDTAEEDEAAMPDRPEPPLPEELEDEAAADQNAGPSIWSRFQSFLDENSSKIGWGQLPLVYWRRFSINSVINGCPVS